MTMKKTLILCAAVLLAEGGCKSTQDIQTFEQLRNASSGSVKAMAKDSTLYEFTSFTVLDSTLDGLGKSLKNGNQSPFAGQLRYSDLVYVQASNTNYFRGLLFCGVLGLTSSWLAGASAEEGLTIWRPSPPGGGSCPYVYAWDGHRYAIQGEVFGTAFGKGLETSTQCMLPAAVEQEGSVLVRLSNERPETHYVNHVRLLGFQTPVGSQILLDADNRGWPVTNPLPPVRSPLELVRRDGIWWTSDLKSTRNGGDFRDVVELTIPHPRGSTSGSLVLHVINTRIVNAVYEVVFGYLGEEQLPFLYQLEHNPQLIEILKVWIEECGLEVQVWKKGGWQRVGAIAPEANEVPFSRVVRLDASGVEEDTLRVRLTSLADTWKIDAVETDWTLAAALSPKVIPLRSARHSIAGSVARQLSASDAEYSMMLPGERIDLTFETLAPEEGKSVAYALEAAGYLYEWMPEAPATSGVPAMFAQYAPDRLTVVNYLLRHREALLSVVYARWREQRGGFDPGDRSPDSFTKPATVEGGIGQ